MKIEKNRTQLMCLVALILIAITFYFLDEFLEYSSRSILKLNKLKMCSVHSLPSKLCDKIKGDEKITISNSVVKVEQKCQNDCGYQIYDIQSGEILEYCGFWTGVATGKECATPTEIEAAKHKPDLLFVK